MPLKCPICGKEYYYDSKICQICESKFINSGLTINAEDKPKRWNCGIFLEFDTLAFGKHKPDNAYIKISSEPKFNDFKIKKEYNWNCDSQIKEQNFFILRSGISALKSVKKVPLTRSSILGKETVNSLIYE
jgi:hypothetical protein